MLQIMFQIHQNKKKRGKKEAPTSLSGSYFVKVCGELSTDGQLSGDTLRHFILPWGKKTKQEDFKKKSQLEPGNSWRRRRRHGCVSSPTYGAALATKIESPQVDWPVLCNWRRVRHVGICKLSSRQSKPFIASGPTSWSAVSLLPWRVNTGPHSETHEVTETLRNILIMGSPWMFWGAKVLHGFDPQCRVWIICPVESWLNSSGWLVG